MPSASLMQRAAARRQLRRERLRAWFAPLGLAALAVLARTIEALQEPLVFNDGPRFIAAAAAMQRGEWSLALGEPFHPLTSAGMAILSALGGLTLEASGELLSVLAGGVAAAALYAFTRAQFGSDVAILASLAFAVHPRLVQSSSGVQSDGPYLAATVVAVACIWRALATRRPGAAFAAGLACGAAYLVRPEGLLVALVFGGWLATDLWRRRTELAQALAQGGAFAAALALVAAPYVLALHSMTGSWTLSQKKSVTALLEVRAEATPARAPAPFVTVSPDLASAGLAPSTPAAAEVAAGAGWTARVARALGEMAYDFLRAFTPTALALSLCSVSRGIPSRASLFLLSQVGAIALLLLGVHLSAGYVSRRHWLTAATLLLPFAARGLQRLSELSAPWTKLLERRRWLAPALGAAVLAGFLIHSALPRGEEDKRARQRAAEWLRETARPAVVATQRARDAYYAGATRHVALANLSAPEAIVGAARIGGARFLLVDEALLLGTVAAPLGATEVHRVPYPGGAVTVFEVR